MFGAFGYPWAAFGFHLGCLAWGTGVLPLKKDGNDPRPQYSRLGVLSAWGLGDLVGCSFGGLETWFGELVAAWSLEIGGLGR